MFAPLLLVIGLFGVLFVLALTALAGATPRTEDPAARPWLRRTRLRSWLAVAAAVIVGVGTVGFAVAVPRFGGPAMALTPGLAAVAALLVHGVLPYVRPPHDGPVAASLTPRHPGAYGSRADFVVPLALAAATVLVLVGTGLSSAPDGSGHYREVHLAVGPMAAAHGPYPGWWYGVPLALVTVAVLAALGWATHRIVAAPAPPLATLFAADTSLRRTGVRVVSRLASAALLTELCGVLGIAGIGQRALVKTAESNGVAFDGVRGLAALGLLGAAAVVGLAAIVFAGLAVGAALRLPIRFADRSQQVSA